MTLMGFEPGILAAAEFESKYSPPRPQSAQIGKQNHGPVLKQLGATRALYIVPDAGVGGAKTRMGRLDGTLALPSHE